MTSDYTRPTGPLDDPLDPAVPVTSDLSGTTASTSRPSTSQSAYQSTYPSTDQSSTTGGTSTDDTGGIADRAKGAAGAASDAGGSLLEHAKESAGDVTTEAKRQAADLWTQTRDELNGQLGTQQQRLAGGLRTFGSEFDEMASASSQQGVAAELARQLGSRAGDVGRWLEDRGPDDVLIEVREFARRRPGTFLLVAAGAGLVVGRLARALKDSSGQDGTRTTPRTATSSPVRSTPAVGTTGFTQSGPAPEFGSAPEFGAVPASGSVPESGSVPPSTPWTSTGASTTYGAGGRP